MLGTFFTKHFGREVKPGDVIDFKPGKNPKDTITNFIRYGPYVVQKIIIPKSRQQNPHIEVKDRDGSESYFREKDLKNAYLTTKREANRTVEWHVDYRKYSIFTKGTEEYADQRQTFPFKTHAAAMRKALEITNEHDRRMRRLLVALKRRGEDDEDRDFDPTFGSQEMKRDDHANLYDEREEIIATVSIDRVKI
ncbi:hypothetical protein LCGC14_1370920 [marine sediment metagenome]|uniref:Uncharacterized protein n=1 Tax=marine sediment metagenome TaxID=412755 RepID=A0A0F9N7E5_9ZZZZ